ncbi:butyrophilin subfamily 1 member A1-like [Centropristis striata]|uniref:butyrophilin subfamily 1 member A1-like n=1 Tax=Centropristis striata TaxID=184440 RepID=UPI0027DF59E0|nr:butyrophilin subfamily 1 member A1-like [Centropristis striata]
MQPIVANIGDDIILPCYLEPGVDASAMTLEWTRSDLNPIFVHVRRSGQDLASAQNPSYRGRTSVSIDEMKKGNISMKISKVKPSDAGRYKCFIPKLNKESFIQLVVGAVSSPAINLAGIDRDKEGVVLQCESSGWYPEPEVLWLDGEGKLLSAGPTETVRGPDDLYTVSSRVTVEKRHSNSFTCRVHQKDINHTTETQITVPDDFFNVQSSPAPLVTGLAEEQQRRKEAEEEVQTLKEKLETQKKEFENKSAEVQQLKDEKQRHENELQTLRTENQKLKDDLETLETKCKQTIYRLLRPSF